MRLSLNIIKHMDPSKRLSEIMRRDAPRPLSGPVAIDVRELFQGRDEVRLIHEGKEYRLRITKQGKLLLTK